MNRCLYCGKETKNPKFCSRSCSATSNNLGVRHNKTGKNGIIVKGRFCVSCGKKLMGYTSNQCMVCYNEKRSTDFFSNRCCIGCGEIKSISHFYGKSYRCVECTNSSTQERRREFKNELMNYKGGKCSICGYDKYYGALDFHHIDPTKKEISIGKIRSMHMTEKIKNELDKCVLLCSNCHKEVHAGIVKLI